MTARHPIRTAPTRTIQTVHMLLAALAAVIIALSLQGWPAPAPSCEASAACDAG